MEKHTYRTPFDTPNANFLAEIGVPAVMNLNLFADMGRMNGGWP